ncbi:MAG: hypothetical protein IJ572_03795 [Bacilli bacterium]|nr:hypothetical protein [Bacilli bacterium]
MKKCLKYIVLFSIVLFSFYLTERQAILNRSEDPIMKSILDCKDTYNSDAVNASIDDSHIIPGLYGKRINEIKSLMRMKSGGAFNSLFLVTDYIKPDVSLEDNKDKIINKGNSSKKAISIILENDESNIVTYLISENIKADILVTKQSVNSNLKFEQINNDFNNYHDVEKILNKSKINKNICIIGRSNKEFCQRNKKYLIEPTYVFSSNNLLSIKNKISSGDIILVKDSVSIDDISYIIKYIKTKGLSIIYLSELISEMQ